MSLIESDFDVIDYEAGADDEIRGMECCSCFRLLTFNFFDRDARYKSGYSPQCSWCKKQPVLSISEHTARLRERNYNSEGTKRQRHPDQEDFHKERKGEMMDYSLFLQKLHHVYPRLYITPGAVTIDGVPVDISLFATSGVANPDWRGATAKYMGYITIGPMPEYNEYEFDSRDILQRAIRIGWRDVLLRFIKNKVLTEEQVYQEFGRPSGLADSSYWYKKLNQYRNAKNLNKSPAQMDYL
jgi:hypothetical protein